MVANGTPKIDVDALIQQGLTLLKEDLESHPSFDPSRPYDEKNAYFSRTLKLGDWLLLSDHYDVAEQYFGNMLHTIREYEKASGKPFNKGIVYAVLGIAQMAMGNKLDSGIAHLLTADWEDRDFTHDDHGILNTTLWQQFEQPIIFGYLLGFNNDPNATLGFTIDEAFLNTLFREMSKQDRLFLEGTIWALTQNLQQNDVCKNAYTWGRLYSGLKDLCLSAESLLRRKRIRDNPNLAGTRMELTNLLESLGIGYTPANLCSANDLREFVNNLENILGSPDVKIRQLRCLNLVRNFTGHHFDPSDTVTSPNGKSFFDMYDATLTNVLSAILYLKHINAI